MTKQHQTIKGPCPFPPSAGVSACGVGRGRLSGVPWRQATCALFVLLSLAVLLSCGPQDRNSQLAAQRDAADSIATASATTERGADSLVRAASKRGDAMLEMRARRQLGRFYREHNRFMDAIYCHRRELKLAQELGDTVAIVQALNNIGTNFRRMGVLDEAIDCHYQALHYSDAFSHRADSVARKNRVVSLNGIGNISLSLGDLETADSVFRQALAGEHALGSALGQAINYANIGALFEERHQADSALWYYRRSMEMNRQAGSTLGIALCHNHFGRLHEQAGHVSQAIAEYRQAYALMEQASDRWHWLESCLALAQVYVKQGDDAEAKRYLALADQTARDLNSLEHKSEVAKLYYTLYDREGDSRRALASYKLSRELGDSVSSEKNLVHMQNMRIRYEHEQRRAEVSALSQEYQSERTLKMVSLAAALFILLFAAVTTSFLVYALRTRKRKQLAQQQLDEMRVSFFTNITHEFRTPLTVILGYSHMMEQGQLPPDALAEAGHVVSRQGSRLLSLINQLLDISKVKSAVGQPDWRRGDVVLFVSTLVESYLNLAHTRHIQLVYAPKQQAAEADFVPDYLQKVVCNLVSNAIKFSHEGGRVLVTLSVEGDEMTLRVADYGDGIAEADRQRIFEPFYQASTPQMSVGSGVGLALVKQIVVSLRGRVSLDSRVGRGSVFTVLLPTTAPAGVTCRPIAVHGEPISQLEASAVAPSSSVASEPVMATPPSAEPGEAASVKRPLVLIVEDNSDVAQYLSVQLRQRYRLLLASNGEEGLKAAVEHVPDLIITDLMMPVMDGYELCRRIRQNDVISHIPLIVVTAKTSEADKLLSLQTGVDAYIAKPFSADELSLRVEKLLEKHRLLRERYMQAAQADPAEAADTLRPADRAFVERLDAVIQGSITTGDLSGDAIASALCMSGQQLRRKLSAVTGDTPAAYIRRQQIRAAQRLLDGADDLQISEVAMRCGYFDMSHFTRAFKQVTGMTPSQYRQRAGKK